jgi:predicted RNA-binding Zn ribbon-like protein
VEHARALESAGYTQASDVREVTESYMRVRYGGAVIPSHELARLRVAIGRVKTRSQARARQPGVELTGEDRSPPVRWPE